MPAKKGNTPDKIKNTARTIFLANGFRETSMQMIASEVGISAPGLYKHFESKEEIFSALVDPLITAIKESLYERSLAQSSFHFILLYPIAPYQPPLSLAPKDDNAAPLLALVVAEGVHKIRKDLITRLGLLQHNQSQVQASVCV